MGLVIPGGLYNGTIRALQQLSLADTFGNSRIPLQVLNVVYPLVPDELLEFCANKRAALMVEEGQPNYIEESLQAILRRAQSDTRLYGKDIFPMAGEYTGEVLTKSLAEFIKQAAPAALTDQGAAEVSEAAAPLAQLKPQAVEALGVPVPARPPGFCIGCQYLSPHLETWPEITVVHNDPRMSIAGNGFSSIGRLELLTLLYAHVEELGVSIRFDTEVKSQEELRGADLIVAANGAFSWVRSENEDKFGTITDWRPNKFIWYGTSKAFNSLTPTFRETEAGVFCAHHYRYKPDMSTFLVEVEDATWKKVGFEHMSP